MAIFKCKMCGGTIEFEPGSTVGVCDSCGTKQTLPHLDDDRRANLYDRANHFRRNNEFDKATGIYEQILNEDTADAEAYWSLVLCRYGIEYVEDPKTHRRVPTVNRAQFTSIFDDDNYKSALQYADGYQRELYENEAKEINEIQKGILAISQKEEPFDVFICYKETDANGRRTQDSVLANDLYHQLIQEGFKVFYAKITLEDVLGTAYEPYIFAALNSAKVMVVLGTKPEYFNAVWVKNEWSRYLSLVKQSGGKKVLIPAYRDMDPYDLPEEFSHLQAQDMSKLGFMQDLIRGIKKITKANETRETVKETVVVGNNLNIAPLLKRAFMSLEDGEWKKADDFCEQVLNQDPENADAYLGKLMAEFHVRRKDAIAECEQPLDTSNNYQKVLLFGDNDTKSILADCNNNTKYNAAFRAMSLADNEEAFKEASSLFANISGFKDADSLAEQCLSKAEGYRKDGIYHSARLHMNENSENEYIAAIKALTSISGWRDADDLVAVCRRQIEIIQETEERQKREKAKAEAKKKKITILSVALGILLLGGTYALVWHIIPMQKYNKAISYVENNDYDSAYEIFSNLKYKDSSQKAIETLYSKGEYMISQKNYTEAICAFEMIPDYQDSSEKIVYCQNEPKYSEAIDKYNSRDFEGAISLFTELESYSDSANWLNKTKYSYADQCYENKEYEKAGELFESVASYSDAISRMNKSKYMHGKELFESGYYYQAYEVLNEIEYDNSKELASEAMYLEAEKAMNEKRYDDAREYYRSIPNYKDSSEKTKEAQYLRGCEYYDEGKYVQASSQFSTISDYKDAEERRIDSRYMLAKSNIEKGNIDAAITIFESLGEYKDSSVMINEAKYQYVKSHYNNDDLKTCEYLTGLKSIKYLDSEALYSDLYSWKAIVIINKSMDDEVNHYPAFSITREEKLYAHVLLSGGLPDEGVTLVFLFNWGWADSVTLDSPSYDGYRPWFSVSEITGSGTFSYTLQTTTGIKLASGSVRIN